MEQLSISLKNNALSGKVEIKGSKSISNRCLIMQALSGQKSKLENLSDSDDTKRLERYLKMISTCGNSRIPLVIDTGNAGTVMRFLAGFLSMQEGKWLLTGSERMKQRPIGDLVDPLIKLGAQINYAGEVGYPPLLITGANLNSGEIEVDVSKSSQFISALMMIGPYLEEGLKLKFPQPPVSFSYIQMTAGLMESYGAKVELSQEGVFVKPGNYQITESIVEPDWSSASYWYQMVAFAEIADVFLTGYQENSLQGDHVLADIYKQLGVSTYFEADGIRLLKKGTLTKKLVYDCNSCPDLVPAILTTCAAIGVPATLSGIGHLKFKESDRVAVFKTELAKIGAEIQIHENEVELLPDQSQPLSRLVFDTYKDHRVAMSLAPLAIKFGEVFINDPMVVEKSYPAFWDHLQQSEMFTVNNY